MNIRLIIFSGIVSAVTMFASDEISHGIGGNPSVCEERAPESNESKIWSFDDCIDWALEINTDLRRNLLSQLQADQNTAEAKDAWLPTVGFSTVQGFVNYPKPQEGISANGYNSSYGINANWTVWEGNVRKYRLESSRLLRVEKSVQIDPSRRENVTLFVEIRLTLGDEIKMTPVGILRRGFFL